MRAWARCNPVAADVIIAVVLVVLSAGRLAAAHEADVVWSWLVSLGAFCHLIDVGGGAGSNDPPFTRAPPASALRWPTGSTG